MSRRPSPPGWRRPWGATPFSTCRPRSCAPTATSGRPRTPDSVRRALEEELTRHAALAARAAEIREAAVEIGENPDEALSIRVRAATEAEHVANTRPLQDDQSAEESEHIEFAARDRRRRGKPITQAAKTLTPPLRITDSQPTTEGPPERRPARPKLEPAMAKDDEPKKPDDTGDGAGPMLDMSQAAVKKMIATAKARGYITYDELNEVLPPEQVTSEQIEDVMAMLSEMGINVIDNDEADDEDGARDDAPPAADEGGSRELAMTSVGGEALDRTDDPVRMYLREMGSVELLSREGEIAIAKRIEAGRNTMIAGLCESPLTFQAITIWRDELLDEAIMLRDVIDLETTFSGQMEHDEVDSVLSGLKTPPAAPAAAAAPAARPEPAPAAPRPPPPPPPRAAAAAPAADEDEDDEEEARRKATSRSRTRRRPRRLRPTRTRTRTTTSRTSRSPPWRRR